jgi:hypothetical protein
MTTNHKLLEVSHRLDEIRRYIEVNIVRVWNDAALAIPAQEQTRRQAHRDGNTIERAHNAVHGLDGPACEVVLLVV